jgi:hypothetical protein
VLLQLHDPLQQLFRVEFGVHYFSTNSRVAGLARLRRAMTPRSLTKPKRRKERGFR